jgi:hypothetical protein
MEEAMRVVEEFLQRGLEEWYRAAEERGSEPSQVGMGWGLELFCSLCYWIVMLNNKSD